MAAYPAVGVVSGKRRTYQAGSLAITRGVALMRGADDNHVVPATANAQVIGFAEESSVLKLGDSVSVVRYEEAVAVAGAAITGGQYLIANAAGQVVPSTAIGDNVAGCAICGAANPGDGLVVFVNPFIR